MAALSLRDRFLIDVLAATDAVWWPARDWRRPLSQNVTAARLEFSQGVRLPAGGGGEADRKSAQRLREALVAEGLILQFNPRRTAAPNLRLSDDVDLALRKRQGLPGLFAGWLTLRELAQHSTRPGTVMQDRWVNEWELIGRDKTGAAASAEAFTVESLALPALVRGLVVSHATGARQIYYAISPSGWAWLDSGKEPPDDDFDPDRDACDDVAHAYYTRRVAAHLDRLRTMEPDQPNELGFIPLPVAMGGLPLGAWEEHYA